jgi:hypothetical protein
MAVCLYSVCLPVLGLLNCMMPAPLYDVYCLCYDSLPGLYLPTCVMSAQLHVIYAYLHDICLPA